MPAEHLATQGTSILQQLDALAAVHSRIKLGQPAVVDALHVQRADTQQGRDFVILRDSQPSPSGDCAVVFWYSYNREQTTRECAAVFGTGPERWRVPLLASTPSQTQCVGWSRDGRYCTALCQRHEARPGRGLFTSTFDLAQRCWLQEVPICSLGSFRWWRDIMSGMSVSGDGTLAAALVTVSTLLVFAVFEPFSVSIPAAGAMSLAWVPGQHVVLVLGQQGLACVHLDPRPVGPVSLTWEQRACVSAEPRRAWTHSWHGYQQMCVEPDGRTVWVAHTSPAESLVVMGCDTATLSCVSGPHLLAECVYTGHNFRPEVMSVSRQALAVCTSASYGWQIYVHALEGSADRRQLGRRLFVSGEFGSATFSADGRFIVGVDFPDYVGPQDTLVILDARNGDCIASLELVAPPFNGRDVETDKLIVRWSASDPGQVHVKWVMEDHDQPELGDSLVFAVVQL